MNINVTLFFQMVAFGLFVWFVMSKVWPPLHTAMEERRKKIADGLAAAERGEKALEQASAKSEEELAAARTKAQEIISTANRQSNEIVERAKAEARTEADRIVANAHAEIEAEVERARTELRKQVGTLAVSGAEKILQREVDANAHDALLKQLATQI